MPMEAEAFVAFLYMCVCATRSQRVVGGKLAGCVMDDATKLRCLVTFSESLGMPRKKKRKEKVIDRCLVCLWLNAVTRSMGRNVRLAWDRPTYSRLEQQFSVGFELIGTTICAPQVERNQFRSTRDILSKRLVLIGLAIELGIHFL